MDTAINFPGGSWKPSRAVTIEELDRANNVLVAARASGWSMVTFEGVSYRWVPEKLAVRQVDPEIESRFSSHQLGPNATDVEEIRGLFRDLAYEVKRLVPPGREQSMALTHLDEGAMIAVAGIARKP